MSAQPSLYRIDGEEIRLSLHEGQQRAWDSLKRFVFVLAGTQSGKTSFGPWWLWREIERAGQGDYLAATASYDLFKLKMLPELRTVFCDLLGGEYHASDRTITYRGSRIILRSAESEGGLESATAKAAWLDECGQDSFGLETWEAVLRRLSLSRGRVLGTTTLYNLGWLVQLLESWQRGERPEYDFIRFNSLANPLFPREEYERARSEMPSWRFAMFYEGLPARPAGLIYSDFDPAVHWVKPFDIPGDWQRYLGVDPGGSNTALLWLARAPEGLCYVYRELHTGGLTTRELVAKAQMYEPLASVWGGAEGETQFRRDWTDAGLQVAQPLIADVEQGISRVIEMFKGNRLFVFNNLAGLRDQLGSYSRVLDDAGTPTDKIKDKERYHLLDALRYVVSGIGRPADAVIRIRRPAFTGGR